MQWKMYLNGYYTRVDQCKNGPKIHVGIAETHLFLVQLVLMGDFT